MSFIAGCRDDITGDCWPLLTYYSMFVVNDNHLLSISGRHVACKRLVNVY